MKLIVFTAVFFLTAISCLTSNQQNNVETKQAFPKYIDKNEVSKIQLLIVDTSIIDLPSKQLTKLIDIGTGQSFVDSSGKPFCKPSQIITFTDSGKDSLISIFNSLLDSSQYSDVTTCITLYNHVFVLYNKENKISEQVDFAFDCPIQFNFLHRGKLIRIEDDNSELMKRLVVGLKNRNAYIPVFGSPSVH